MLRPNERCFDVSLAVRIPERMRGAQFYLTMPVWTPGHYLIEDFARNLPEVKAFDLASGKERAVLKRTKNRWMVDPEGSGGLKVEYSAYALAYEDTKSYIDPNHALINGASLFLCPEGMESEPVHLTLIPHASWRRASTGLDQVSEWEFVAPNYDILVDSPVEVGNQDVASFEVQGVEHQVSMFDAGPLDREKFVADLKTIVEASVPVFGVVPYKRYVFLVGFTDELGGGLEHLNSTVCLVPRFRIAPKEEYNLMMSLFSHEFFHAWNVKRLRPKGLGPFNYSNETYTKSLWIAEGITSYYDDLILRRGGIYSVGEYLDAFAINVNILKSLPGTSRQSAEEASFDTWIKFYKPDANSPNVTSSYYTQGAVIGWMLDMAIRKATAGSKNLDDAMRTIYQETFVREGRGYTDEEFEAVCRSIGGEGIGEIFDSRVRGREDVDYDRFLGYAGLRLGTREEMPQVKGFLGVRLGSEGGRTFVRTTLAGSPAESMGLIVNDELLGVDGLRASSERLSFYFATRKPGESVKLAIARNGKLMEVGGELGVKPPFEFRVRPLKEATDEQKAFFRGWLLADWSPEIRYPEYLRSPDRKAVLDFV
jgi:predicted metalloprotease with PDZ domain